MRQSNSAVIVMTTWDCKPKNKKQEFYTLNIDYYELQDSIIHADRTNV